MGMTAENLRISILQRAMEGKLVSQNPDDEPVSALLSKIDTERKLKLGNKYTDSCIYKDEDGRVYEKVGGRKNDINDEILFEIPNTWKWVRLGELFSHNTGKPLNSSNRSGRLLKYITTSNMYWNRFELDSLREMYFTETEVEKCTVKKGNLLVCEGGDFGRAAIWDYDYDICIQNHIHRLISYGPICVKFYYYVFYLYKHAGWIKGNGIAIQGLSSNRLHNLLVPLPPIEEQERIVKEIDDYEPLLEEYGTLENKLSNLDANIHDKLWKSILQYAIEGKLVPQNSEDEPASVLLKKIYDKREANINKRLVKNGAHEFRIYRKGESYFEFAAGKERCIDNEIPFEIPDNWQWTKLGYISNYDATKEKVNSRDINVNSWELDLEDIEKGGRLIVKKTAEEKGAIGDKTVFHKGDILYSKLRPYLLKIMLAPEDGICTPEIVPFSVYGGIDSEYIVYYLKSPYVDSYINGITYGVKMPRVGTKTMVNLYVPIPPYEEQKRIVNEIEKYESLLGGLSELV